MQNETGSTVPYCGAPPMPGEFLGAWNLDPRLLAGFALAAPAYLLVRKGVDGERRSRFYAMALLVLALAFLSPLCALSSALFSARVFHHVLLISVVAPLLAVALPARGASRGFMLPVLVLTHMIAVWVWHAPAPYEAALSSDALYWTMELTLLGTGILLWRELLRERSAPLGAGLAHLLIIALMGLLGALITFAPIPLYRPHFLSAELYGLSALEDQQLAGLLMWAPAMIPNLIAALSCVRRIVEGAPQSAAGSIGRA